MDGERGAAGLAATAVGLLILVIRLLLFQGGGVRGLAVDVLIPKLCLGHGVMHDGGGGLLCGVIVIGLRR